MADLYTVNCMFSLGCYAPTLPIVHLLFFCVHIWTRWKVVWEELLPRLFCGRRSLWTTSHCMSHIYMGLALLKVFTNIFIFLLYRWLGLIQGSVTNRSAIKNFHNCQIQIEARIGVIGPEGVSRETARFWLSKKIKTSLKMHEQRLDLSNTSQKSHCWTMDGDQRKKSHMMVKEP